MNLKFALPTEAVEIHVVGAGGTGSAFLGPLAQMALALPQLGHPGIHVTVWDDDIVSMANIGRQVFAPSDVGCNKALTLVNRINLSYGLRWHAQPMQFDGHARLRRTHVLIGAVDTRRARLTLHGTHVRAWDSIWIDCGNSASTGQVVLGYRRHGDQIAPSVADLFPEIVDVAGDAGDDQPSCSVAEALAKQDLMVNRMMADAAAALLWQVLRHGELQHHGAFIDARAGRSTPLPVDAEYWATLGWSAA